MPNKPMNYDDQLKHVTVLGAAGKMGSGILLLTAMEMANQRLKPENKNRSYELFAMDVSEEGLKGLIEYLNVQVQKVAEKKVEALKTAYADKPALKEDADFINQYVADVLAIVKPVTSIEAAYNSTLIFEVIKEDPALKVKIFKQIDENNPNKPWFFTNTSSIPINKLNVDANLGGRILGVHFYNPPAIQKLVEVIRSKETPQEIVDFCSIYIKNLKKIGVPSNDFAGFIGNGHFMRDAIHGISEAFLLGQEMPLVEAIYTINRIGQDYLIRPMGIFQLIDYVGIDVCSYILSVMQPYFPQEDLKSPYLDMLIAQGVRGGQQSSGAQKDGIFKYEKGKMVGIWDTNLKEYIAIDSFQAKCDERLGALPTTFQPWKVVNFSPEKEAMLVAYFNELKTMNTMGAQLAKYYLQRCVEIGKELVSKGVANNEQDVNTVMLTGFYHAYGPINRYL
jgi:3-hydroxyacyl-CoA dehydrogenase